MSHLPTHTLRRSRAEVLPPGKRRLGIRWQLSGWCSTKMMQEVEEMKASHREPKLHLASPHPALKWLPLPNTHHPPPGDNNRSGPHAHSHQNKRHNPKQNKPNLRARESRKQSLAFCQQYNASFRFWFWETSYCTIYYISLSCQCYSPSIWCLDQTKHFLAEAPFTGLGCVAD